MLTTWPVFTEAMHLAKVGGGWRWQSAIWQMRSRGALQIAAPSDAEADRASTLMEKYRDLPMALADASLVALAEARGIRRMFTLDSHFQVYRYRDREPFELLPARR